jgi:hypothetical protein
MSTCPLCSFDCKDFPSVVIFVTRASEIKKSVSGMVKLLILKVMVLGRGPLGGD